jgi:hypothetical protein
VALQLYYSRRLYLQSSLHDIFLELQVFAIMTGIVKDVYKQYKEDTEFVAGWLAEMSLRCGYELTTLGGQPCQTPQGLNRKAGK